MPGPRFARKRPTGVSSPSAASSSTRLVADAHRRRLDALLLDALAMLEPAAEQPLVRRAPPRRGPRRRRRRGGSRAPPPGRCYRRVDVRIGASSRQSRLLGARRPSRGCGGGGSKSNGEAAKPADAGRRGRKGAPRSPRRAVHVRRLDHRCRAAADARPPTSRGTRAARGRCRSRARRSRSSASATRRISSGSDAFLQQVRRRGAARSSCAASGSRAPRRAGDLAALAPLTDIGKLFNGALGSHGKLQNAGETTIQGAEGRRDRGHGRRAGRSTSRRPGTPYPVAIVGDKRPGRHDHLRQLERIRVDHRHRRARST